MDSVEDVIFVKDRDGRFVFVNKQIAGDTSLLGKRVQDLYPAELADVYIRADAPVLNTGETTRIDETILIKGVPRQFQTVKVPWWQDNEIVGLIGVARDLTERLQAESEVRESRRKLETLIDNLPGLVYTARPELPWPIIFFSEGVETLTGHPADGFSSGRINWADIVHPEDLAELERTVSQACRSRTSFSAVYRIITASSEIRWVLDRG
ncbi:PAS domain-containing protein, partial [Microvirga sp. P5_D2]